MTESKTFWHVAPSTYVVGDDLRCWDDLAVAGIVTEADWKWDEAPVGFDGHFVSVSADTEEGRSERDEMSLLVDGAIVLRIDVPEGAEVEWAENEDGAFREELPLGIVGSIPAAWITVVEA